jgi:hypothetical protein
VAPAEKPERYETEVLSSEGEGDAVPSTWQEDYSDDDRAAVPPAKPERHMSCPILSNAEEWNKLPPTKPERYVSDVMPSEAESSN